MPGMSEGILDANSSEEEETDLDESCSSRDNILKKSQATMIDYEAQVVDT